MTKNRINLLLLKIENDIAGHEETIAGAMALTEDFNIPTEAYKLACETIALNAFVCAYLKSIVKKIADAADMEVAERIIRFHSYYQREKGNLTDGKHISAAQATVMTYLDGYIDQFFK